MDKNETFTIHHDLPDLVGAWPRQKGLLADVLARIRTAYPDVQGLSHVNANTAVFQIRGDSTRYCLRITREEAEGLGYIARR